MRQTDAESWCLDHYQSYNPSTNTYRAYSGEIRTCRPPANLTGSSVAENERGRRL
jgi:hypothetical protein